MDVQNGTKQKLSFDEALDKTGFGLYSFQIISISCINAVAYMCLMYGASIIVPVSACELETSTYQQGLLASGAFIGGIIGSPLWGYLGDKRGRRNMLMISLLSSAVFNALASLSVHWVMLMTLQCIAVVLGSGIYVLTFTIVGECVPSTKRNFSILIVIGLILLGQGLMAVIAIPISPLNFSIYLSALGIYWNSWRTIQLVYSVPCLISAFWLYFMQESPKFVYSLGDEHRAINILKIIHRVNHRNGKEFEVDGILAQADNTEKVLSGMEQFLPLIRKPLLKLSLSIVSLVILVQTLIAVLVWLPLIANQFVVLIETGEGADMTLCQIFEASLDQPADPNVAPCSLNSTGLLVVFGICFLHMCLNGTLSVLINIIGIRNSAIALVSICGASGILVNLVNNVIGTAFLFIIYSLGVLVMGFYTTMTVIYFPTPLRSMAVSLMITISYIASFGLTQVINYLLMNSCNLGFYLFSGLFLSSIFILATLPSDREVKLDNDKSTAD